MPFRATFGGDPGAVGGHGISRCLGTCSSRALKPGGCACACERADRPEAGAVAGSCQAIRESNVRARDVFAVTDGDAWAEKAFSGTFDSTLVRPAYPVVGGAAATLTYTTYYRQ